MGDNFYSAVRLVLKILGALNPSHIGTKGRMMIKLVKAGSWVGNNAINISCIGVVTG